MDNKVYVPEVVPENPYPGEEQPLFPNQSSGTDIYTPTVVAQKPFKQKKIASELLSTALNTRSRKILGEFQLQQSGGLKIGDFQEGLSGDLRLTPNGITARDQAGLTTFSIDATTGDAVFKGTVQAGDVTVVDEGGLISLSSFSSDNVTFDSGQAINDAGSDPEYTDINGASLSLSLIRETNVLIMFSLVFIFQLPNQLNAIASIALDVDGTTSPFATFIEDTIKYTPALTTNASVDHPVSLQTIYRLGEGDHTIKMKAYCTNDAGNSVIVPRDISLTYLALGR